MALALYRRYRPDTFDRVIGQDQVTVPLMHALDNNRLTHAYLFSGPRGCGKTSSARILARCINCVKGPTSHPCGECDSCRDLATGGPGSIDVVEIDAASHNGVDDARELRERAGFAPARDRFKIFILDEAHMVTQQGFNALLKIVEEPPEHVMFIFATTEPEKVIGTIRSRTHHYPFRLVPQEIMGPYLEGICQEEGIQPEGGVLKLAMRAGGGSVRDTLSVLDQLMVGAEDGVIAYDSAVALLGFTPDVLIDEAMDALTSNDGAALYGVIQKVVVGGFDGRRFVEDLLARVRDLLVIAISGDEAAQVLGDDMADRLGAMRQQADELGLPMLTAMAETLDEALASMSGAVSGRMRLELLAARLMAGRELGFAIAGAQGVPAAAAPPASTAVSKEQAMAAAQAQGGFIGAKKAAAPQQHTPAAQSDAESSSSQATGAGHGSPTPAAPAPAAIPERQTVQATAAAQQPSAPAQPPAPASAAGAGVPAASQDSAQPAAHGEGASVDERWDAIVAALPADAQRYVNRAKVPRVMLAPDKASGRERLWIKFDKPVSKYAFALAVINDPISGTMSLPDIMRARVRETFGERVQLAPTEKMADGQKAPAFSKLDPARQQQVKAQVAQASLQEKMGLALRGDASASNQSGHTVASASPSTASSRSTPAGSSASGAADDEEDPWAASAEQIGRMQTHFGQPANPAPQPAHAPAAEPKRVPVPDPDDDEDPWANPPASQAHHDEAKAPAQAQADPWEHVEPAAASSGWGAHVPAAPAEPEPEEPVAPEEDVYSLSDQSLESAGEMGLDELKEIFEVKKVETFAPDDPKNPKNMHARKGEFE